MMAPPEFVFDFGSCRDQVSVSACASDENKSRPPIVGFERWFRRKIFADIATIRPFL
jgi:hypothetical protein